MDRPKAGVWLAALGVAITSFLAYWIAHGNGPYWQDAGGFVAALKTGGGLAPPGYPLYLILGRPFTALFGALFPHRPFTEAANLFSSVWAALAAGLVTACVLLVLMPGYRFFATRASADTGARGGPSRHAYVAAVTAGIMAGLSYSLWFQAVTAEAYAMHAFFVMLVLYLLLLLGAEGPLGSRPTSRQRWLAVAVFVAHGLSFGNHPATVTLLPMLAWIAFQERAALRDFRFVASIFVAYGLSGLLPYLYLPWAASAHPTLQGSHLTTLSDLANFIAGTQWTAHEQSYGWSSDRFEAFPLQLFQELFVIGLLGTAIGAIRIFREQRSLARCLLILLLPSWLLPMFYLQGGEYDFWLIPVYLVLFMIAGVGFDRVLAWLNASVKVTGGRIAWITGAAIIATAGAAPEIAVNFPLINRRHYFVPEDFARNLYRHVAHNGVLFASSDQECALTYYLQTVKHYRPDVIRVDTPLLCAPWYGDSLKRIYPTLHVPADLSSGECSSDIAVARLVSANQNDRTFYISKRPKILLPDNLAWVPSGGLWKLSARGTDTIDLKDWVYVYRNKHPFDGPARDHAPRKLPQAIGSSADLAKVVREPYTAQIKRFHEQAWKNLGDWYFERQDYAKAADAYLKLFAMAPTLDSPPIFFLLGKSLFAANRDGEARLYLERIHGRLDMARNAEAMLYLGQIYAREGRAAAARSAFAKVRTMSPELWRQNAPLLIQKGYFGPDRP